MMKKEIKFMQQKKDLEHMLPLTPKQERYLMNKRKI
jgi:hypothetical protein